MNLNVRLWSTTLPFRAWTCTHRRVSAACVGGNRLPCSGKSERDALAQADRAQAVRVSAAQAGPRGIETRFAGLFPDAYQYERAARLGVTRAAVRPSRCCGSTLNGSNRRMSNRALCGAPLYISGLKSGIFHAKSV